MYFKILTDEQLQASGAPTTVDVVTLASGAPRVAICLSYLAGDPTGKPGYRLYWQVPTATGSIEVLATLRDETPEVTSGDATGVLREYQGDVICEDLLGSDGTVTTYREVECALGATGVRIEPFEAGKLDDPGVLNAWIGGSAS